MKLSDFICEKCGECCRHVDIVEELKPLQTNGICKYLKNNLCTIYEHRPDVCRREKVFERYKEQMTEEEFTDTLVYYCNYYKKIKKDTENE